MLPFYMILTKFCENSRVVSSDFSMMKNFFASFSASLRIKLISWFESRFSNLICLLKFIAISFEKFS